MVSVVVAAWTWTIAYASISGNPVWALVIAAIGGFALGIELMNQVEKSEAVKSVRRRTRRPSLSAREPGSRPRLRVA